MNFAEFKLTQNGSKLTQELRERAGELVKSGKSFTPEQMLEKIKTDKDLSAFLKDGLQKFKSANPQMADGAARAEFVRGIAAELPSGLRSDPKNLVATYKELRNAIDSPAAASPAPSLQAAAREITGQKKPTGVVDKILGSPEELGKVGGVGVSRTLRAYKDTLDNIISHGTSRGMDRLSDAERAGIRAAEGAFVKASTEAGIPEQEARENFLNVLGTGFAKGSDNRRDIEKVLGKPTTSEPKTAPRTEPKFEQPAAPAKAEKPTTSGSAHVAEELADDASKAAKLLNDQQKTLLLTELDAIGKNRRATKIDNLAEKFESLKDTLLSRNLIDISAPRTTLAPAQVLEKIKRGDIVSAGDFSTLETHFKAWHTGDIPHPSTQTASHSAAANAKGVVTSEAIGAVKESLQSSKSLAHVKDYLGKEGYKAVREDYETYFQRHKWGMLGTGFLTLGSLIAQATDSSTDEYDNNLGWGARIEYNLAKMATGLPWAGGYFATRIKEKKSDNPVIQALQGALKETEKRGITAQQAVDTVTQGQQSAQLQKDAQQSQIAAASKYHGGGTSTATGMTPKDKETRFNDLEDPQMSPLSKDEVSILKQGWDKHAGSDGIMSAEEQSAFGQEIDGSSLPADKKAVAKSFLLAPRLEPR